jgi:RHS repeat-associated protein
MLQCMDYLPFGEEIARTDCGAVGRGQARKFTGKERDSETGLDYFGARYMSAAQGRFTSPDPIMANPLRILNPQRWNMYAYAVNSPFAFTDPDGRDAIAVNFERPASGLGHVGMIAVRTDGSGVFSDFGPRHSGRPLDGGQVNTFDLDTRLIRGSDGLPTRESLKAVAAEVARREGQPADSINLAYFKTSEAETLSLLQYIGANTRRDPQTPYVLGMNDCRTYCIQGFGRANVISPAERISSSHASFYPNALFNYLQFLSDMSYRGRTQETKKKEKVTSRIIFNREEDEEK